MGRNNEQLFNIARKYLGQGGARFRKYCGLPSGAAWCCAFVTYIFHEGDDSPLFYGGKKVVYCPTAQSWCRANLAQIPIYLALPMDILFFDWQPNGTADHIGFVRERKSDQEVYTIEGNTSGGIVAQKTRVAKYICGCYRPHFRPTGFDASKKLTVDGYFGYNSIAVMQKWLGVKVDAVLGKDTVKALQKKLGVTQDGSWGAKTSKALQKLIGTTADGAFGPKSVKAFQAYLNKKVFPSTSPVKKKTLGDKIADTAKSYVGKVKYVKGGTNLKTGVDCTGFVQAIYGLNGIKLSNKLSDWGKSIGKDVSKALPGDIFTYKNKTGIHHGIYVGGGKVVHAANPKEGVKISKWSGMSRPLVGIRRRWK